MTTSNTNKTISTIAAHRIEDLFDDFCIYIAKRYDASYDDAILDWNCVGATFRYFGSNIHIQLKVWKHSNGHNNLPDDIIVLSEFVTGSGLAQDKNEFVDFCNFTFKCGSPLRLQTPRRRDPYCHLHQRSLPPQRPHPLHEVRLIP